MKGKIKKLFTFIKRAWCGGIYGKCGLGLALFAGFMFIGLFWGDVNIQRFGMNIWRIHNAHVQLDTERSALDTLQHHIELLQNYSPDYVSELGLKYLNIGDPGVKILKI